MRRALIVPAAALLFAAVGLSLGLHRPISASAEPTPPEAVDALLDATGLKHQARLVAAQTRETLQSSLGGLGDGDGERVERIARWYFNPDAFYALLRTEFSRHVDETRLVETRAWFETPAGRRIAAGEVRFYATDRRREVEEFVAGLVNNRPSPTRVELLQRLDAAAGATEGALDLMIAMHRAIVRVMEPTVPADQRLGAGQLESQGRRIRLAMQETLKTVNIATMLFLYLGVTDDDLRSYIDFMESDAGAWYGAAARRATIATIVSTVERSAAEFVRVVPPERWTSGETTRPPLPTEKLKL